MAISETPEIADLLMIDRPKGWRAASFPYLMFSPAFLLIACVSFIPIGYAFVQSFFRSNTLALGRFVGAANYNDFFFTLNGFETLKNSLIFVAGTVLIAVPFGFVLALVLSRPIPFREFSARSS